MRKFLLGITLSFCMTGVAFAEDLSIRDVLAKVPALKQGIAYSLADNKLNYLSTFEVLKWKGLTLEAGYAGRADQTGDKAVAVLSYNVAKLKDFGVEVPILDLVELNVGAYAGFGRVQLNDGMGDGNNELDYGLSATLISVKF